MKISLAGYTVVEVMLFLAISSILFIAAAGVFNGRRQQTEFSQAMQDIQSQFRTYANQVATSNLPELGSYSCKAVPSGTSVRPVLSAGGTISQDCILLGRAIQLIPSTDTIFSYPVLGLRTVYAGVSNTGSFPASAAEASPEPALDNTPPPAGPKWLMVDQYNIPGGLTVKSTSFSNAVAGSNEDILMLYSSLQNSNTTGTEINVYSPGFSFSPGDEKSGTLKECIEGISCNISTPIRDGIWKLCLESDSGRQAELAVRSTSTGITTNLNMNGCT